MTAEFHLHPTRHPAVEDLGAYQEGRLPRESIGPLQDHLASCEACSTLLLELIDFSRPDTDETEKPMASIEPQLLSRWVFQQTETSRMRRFLPLAAGLAAMMVGLVAFALGRGTAADSSTIPMKAVVNLPIVEVMPPTSRQGGSEAQRIQIPENAEYLALLLSLDHLDPYPDYRAHILSEDGQTVWSADGLRPGRFDTFSLGIPALLLPTGAYRLRLSGITSPDEQLIEEFSILLEASSKAN